jgi:hypothetical protein
MNVRKIQNIGTGQTTTVGPTRLIVIDQLPVNGSWSITGQIHAFEQAAGRTHAYLFQLAMNGSCAAGVATETDALTPPYTVAPAPAGGWAALALGLLGTDAAPIASGPILEIEMTGLAAPTIIDWAWDLTLVFVDAPEASAPPGPSRTSARPKSRA